MQKNTKNAGLIIFALIAIVSTFLISTIFNRGCSDKPTIPTLSDAQKKEYVDFFSAHQQAPGDFILSAVDTHEIVFVSNAYYHTTFETFRPLVPAIYKKGVKTIGLDFLLADDQPTIDSLVTADAFDEAKARRLLTYYFILFSFEDHKALLKDVWALNRARPRGQAPLRLLGLGLKVNRDLFTDEAYRDRKDLQKAELHGMSQDTYSFNIIDREILQKKEKAVLFLNQSYCLKNAMQPNVTAAYKQIGIPYDGNIAMLVRAKIGDQAYSILFHNLWIKLDSSTIFPMGGPLDAVMHFLPEDKAVTAFTVADSPFADLPMSSDFKDKNEKLVTLKELCDAYILDGPLFRYQILPLAADSIATEDVRPILSLQGVTGDALSKTSADEFITKSNRQVDKANADMASLPH